MEAQLHERNDIIAGLRRENDMLKDERTKLIEARMLAV